jgi:sterol desaturase/sphingolipid hydroxylase (fatty acid hydroxylase superfamily)
MRSNFSTKLAIWDWIFGTAYLPPEQQATGYGIRTWFPKHYLGQTLYAFRPLRSGARSRVAAPMGVAVDADSASIGDF